MKSKSFISLAAAAMLLSLAACSKDDAGQKVITPDMTTSYAKVSISMPSVTGSRAWGDDANFVDGTEDEQAIETIALVLYDEDGMVVGSGSPIDNSFTFDSDESVNVTSKKDLVFKLTLNEGAPMPSQVVAFINTPAVSFDLNENVDNALNDIETNESVLTGGGAKFPMTNSGYYTSDGKYVVAAELDENYFYADQSSAAAGTKATEIYVERLAAKVTVTNNASDTTAEINIVDVAGNEVSIDFNVNNWGATGTANSMYLLKKKFAYTAATDSWMNAADKFRSYWAEGKNWDKTYENYSEDDVLTYLTYGQAVKAFGTDAAYVSEHTYPYATLATAPRFNAEVPSTSVIVIGNYTITDEDGDATWFDDQSDEEGFENNVDFYLRYTGADQNGVSNYIIYNKSQFIAYLLNYNGIDEVATTSGGEGISTAVTDNSTDFTAYFDVEKDETDGRYKLVAGEQALYAGDGLDEAIDADDLTKTSLTKHYNHGLAYFYVPIVHNPDQKDKTGIYGVVRNHAYVINITAIPGLGAPLDEDYTDGDPDEQKPIVPDPDDLNEAYIKATINVLTWHQNTQNVVLK